MTQSPRFSPLPLESAADSGIEGRLSPEEVSRAYELYGQDLHAFLIGVLRNSDLAQDALQQTFQKLTTAGSQAKPESLRGWLFQVAYREALQLRRREHREQKHQRQWWIGEPVSGGESHPADRLATQELIERLRAAIQELPAEQRQVLERRIHGDETFAEIARSMSAPLGTILTRMRLAMERLRKRLHHE